MPKKHTTYRILILDHHAEDAAAIANVLQLYNFVVMKAYTSADAIAIAEAWTPHLFLAEVKPGIDDAALLNTIRSLPSCGAIPAIAMHGKTSIWAAEKAKDAHFDASFVKPIRIQELMALIEYFLWSDRQGDNRAH